MMCCGRLGDECTCPEVCDCECLDCVCDCYCDAHLMCGNCTLDGKVITF